MALVVCCPCGNPLECDQLELVVTLTCPRCSREVLLETDAGPGPAVRAVLTVMEGPHWVGEQFIIPVGTDLSIGSAGGNWLSLDGEGVSEGHCRLRVDQPGVVSLEDLRSPSGTWIGTQRILRGRLAPQQSFKVGAFRFRLDLQSADGADAVVQMAAVQTPGAQPLPMLARVTPLGTPGHWLVANRFHVSRILLSMMAWFMGLHHACSLHCSPGPTWPRAVSCLTGMAILGLLIAAGHRVTLAHRYLKFTPLLVLVVLATADIAWGLPGPAIAGLVLAAGLALLLLQTPTQPSAVAAALLGATSITVMIVLMIERLVDFVSSQM